MRVCKLFSARCKVSLRTRSSALLNSLELFPACFFGIKPRVSFEFSKFGFTPAKSDFNQPMTAGCEAIYHPPIFHQPWSWCSQRDINIWFIFRYIPPVGWKLNNFIEKNQASVRNNFFLLPSSSLCSVVLRFPGLNRVPHRWACIGIHADNNWPIISNAFSSFT